MEPKVECNVTAHEEVHCDRLFDGFDGKPGWTLCFQKCTYVYSGGGSDGVQQEGYRFIWRHPSEGGKQGKLQAGRAQARLPSAAEISELMGKAKAEGWLK